MKFVVFFALFVAAAAKYGFDVAYDFPQESWNCLHNQNGMSFAVVRCYMSTGEVDPNCASSVQKAWNSGLERVDLYMFPCPTCGNAAGQVNALYNYISSNGVKFNQLWLDIEGPEYWMGQGDNRNFYEELSATTNKLFPTRWGVYTNKNGWESIFGAWTPSLSCPLWHAYWDNTPSLSGFTPFDGFNSRAMKQYHGGTTLCSMSVDLDAY